MPETKWIREEDLVPVKDEDDSGQGQAAPRYLTLTEVIGSDGKKRVNITASPEQPILSDKSGQATARQSFNGGAEQGVIDAAASGAGVGVVGDAAGPCAAGETERLAGAQVSHVTEGAQDEQSTDRRGVVHAGARIAGARMSDSGAQASSKHASVVERPTACGCAVPDPVMQADGKFYCHRCSFQTGARPYALEPERWMREVATWKTRFREEQVRADQHELRKQKLQADLDTLRAQAKSGQKMRSPQRGDHP